MFLLRLLFLSILCTHAWGQSKAKLISKFAVFPIAGLQSESGDEAWWQIRELMTSDQRFYVANRRFMVNRGVFQPRSELKPADVIILGKILEAEALAVNFIVDRTFHMIVYETESGTTLWKGQNTMSSIVSLESQLIRTASQVVDSFLQAVPFHTYQIIDEGIGKALFEIEGKTYAKAFKSPALKIEVGNAIQWIEVSPSLGQPLYSSDQGITIIAEGTVTAVDEEDFTIEVHRLRNQEEMSSYSLIRIPALLPEKKIVSEDAQSGQEAFLGNEYLASEIRSSKESQKDHRPTSAILSWIVSLAGFILLGF